MVPQVVQQLQGSKSIKPGRHMTCELLKILTLPEGMIQCSLHPYILQSLQQNVVASTCIAGFLRP